MTSERSALKSRAIILDANILVRAVLGRRVMSLLNAYSPTVDFVVPDIAFRSLEASLPGVLRKRGVPQDEIDLILEGDVISRLHLLVTAVGEAVYSDHEQAARRRLMGRDEADWHYAALSMLSGCPIWTEDQDFFGSGIPIWTTDRVEIYLSGSG